VAAPPAGAALEAVEAVVAAVAAAVRTAGAVVAAPVPSWEVIARLAARVEVATLDAA
jgi:hypothetical protein